MCGIFGYLGPAAGTVRTRKVLESLRHRGPDAQGSLALPGLVLAHTRLSILDLSDSGRQPMASADGQTWIVFNGEIYNYLELREQFPDYPFRTRTDTEVILAAYERWGLDFVDHLRGMFSIGLWDAGRRRLVLAVDRFGIKPCYVHQEGGELRFASEIKALAESGVALAPDEATLHAYLVHGRLETDERTFFRGITRLRAGQMLVHEDGASRLRTYWTLGPGQAPRRTPAQWLDEADQALRESVRLHLRSDVEYGLALSSGLDSNLLRCMIPAVAALSRPLKCFSFCFPGTGYDECADLGGADATGVEYNMSRIFAADLRHDLAHLVRMQEGPVAGAGFCGFFRAMRLAAQRGVKVILSGQGADELFAGYKYHYELRLKQLHDAGDTEAFERELLLVARAHGEDSPAAIQALRARAQGRRHEGAYASDGTALGAQSYVRPEFAAAHAKAPALAAPDFGSPVRGRMYADLFQMKIPKLLMFQDKMAMASAVEVRVPFLDHVLFERLFAVPEELLLREGYTKHLLRQVAARFDDPIARSYQEPVKRYMPTPQREWLKYELTDWVRAMIADSLLHDRGYIDKTRLAGEYEAWVGDVDLGNSYFIWKFMNLELLFREFGL